MSLIAKMPLIAVYGYHAYRHYHENQNLILRNTDRIEMSMAEFIDFTKSVVKEAVAETYGEYMSRNEAIRHLGSRKKLEQAIKMKLINPDKGNGNQKWRVKTREVIEAYKIIDKL